MEGSKSRSTQLNICVLTCSIPHLCRNLYFLSPLNTIETNLFLIFTTQHFVYLSKINVLSLIDISAS